MEMPPLNISAPSNATASSGLDMSGSIFHASGPGDWNVSLGQGVTLGQGAGLSTWLIAAAALAAWLLLKKG